MTLPTSIRKNTGLHIILLLVAGLLLVFIDYLNIPKYMTFDEIEFAKLALSLGKAGYAPYSALATGHATFYFYVILLSFKLFGISKVALRLPSAISGVLDPIIFYLVLRQFFTLIKRKDAEPWSLLIALLFMTSRWYFNFARFGFEATFLLVWELLSLFFILYYANTKRSLPLILSGVCSGLSYNSYQPGRLFFLIPLTFLLFEGFRFRGFATFIQDSIKHTLSIWKQLVSFAVPFILVVAPLTIYLSIHPDIRMYQLFYPDNHETALITKIAWFGEDVWKTFAMFFFKGDMNGRHNYTGKPALNPISGILFVVGLVMAFRSRKDNRSWIFFFWLALSLIPTLLTYPWENPNMLRTITVTPAVAFFSGIALMWMYERLKTIHVKGEVLLIALLFLLAAASVAYELRTYFMYQSKVFLESFEAKKELIYYIDHPDKSVFEK